MFVYVYISVFSTPLVFLSSTDEAEISTQENLTSSAVRRLLYIAMIDIDTTSNHPTLKESVGKSEGGKERIPQLSLREARGPAESLFRPCLPLGLLLLVG